MRLARGLMVCLTMFLMTSIAWADPPEQDARPITLPSASTPQVPSALPWHAEFGLTFGTPAGFNIGLGYWPHPYGVRAFGLYLGPSQYGFQLGACRTLSHHGRTRHSVALIGGLARGGDVDWQYLEAAYDLNVSAFFLEVGLAGGHSIHGSQNFRTPQLMAQIGVLGNSALRRGR